MLFFNKVTASGSVKYSSVKAFLKKQSDVIMNYKSIATFLNKSISLSGNHLVYARKHDSDKFHVM